MRLRLSAIRSAVRTGGESTPLLLAALAVCTSVSFQILLPVVPVMVERGGPHGSAGAATTALFVGAMTGELLTPWMMSRQPSTRLLVGGQLLAAFSSLVYVVPHPYVLAMVAAASTRGVGMGVSTVVSMALLSESAQRHRRGAAIGVYGLALSAPGVMMPSIGMFLLGSGHAGLVGAVACASGLAGVLVAVRVPNRQAHLVSASSNLRAALGRPGMLFVVGGTVLTSASFGGVITYAPVVLPLEGLGSAASFLLVVGAARAASRWLAGVLGDRHTARAVLFWAVASLSAGLVILALPHTALTVLIAAVTFGSGYGASQTAAYLAMIERGSHSDAGPVSALWNSSLDMGSSIGGTMTGLAAASYGYGAAAWLLPAVVLSSLPLFLWPAGKRTAKVPDPEVGAGSC